MWLYFPRSRLKLDLQLTSMQSSSDQKSHGFCMSSMHYDESKRFGLGPVVFHFHRQNSAISLNLAMPEIVNPNRCIDETFLPLLEIVPFNRNAFMTD